MPHERPRRLANPSSPSFHTSLTPSTKGAFHTKRVTGAAARQQGTAGGACTRKMYPQLPRTELTHLVNLTYHSHLHLVPPTPAFVVHATACDVSSAHHLLVPCSARPVLYVLAPYNMHSDLG